MHRRGEKTPQSFTAACSFDTVFNAECSWSFGPTLNKEEHLVSCMRKLPRFEGEAYARNFEVPHL
jgi:hypothetical protein